ncbi:MAG: S4 domain-containing protein [Acidobacteriota bacterium]
MRLDLFLKHARILKRRSAAKDAAEGGFLTVNGRPAKASRDVKAGDVVVVAEGGRPTLEVTVLREPLRPVPRGQEGEFFRLRRLKGPEEEPW